MISYDIVDDRRRTRVMKLLKGYGFHVQKSVFECFLNEAQVQALISKLKKRIHEKEDSVRIYRLTQLSVQHINILGWGEVNIPESVKVV